MARKSRKNLPETPLSIPNLYISTALYIRLSVEDNQGRGNSIENQQLILDDYIIDKPEFKVYNTYVDNGLTGTNFERPAFQRMLSDIEAGHIRCVIVKDLSRLGRNAIDAGYYIEQYFSQHNVRFIAITDGYDTADSSTTNGIILPLKNMINEAYAIDIGRKIKAQAHQAMLDGDFIGARAPFGYRKAPDNCHKLLIDEETAPIVRQIFEWAADGVGITTIVVRLNTMKITTLSKYKTATTEANKHYKQGEYWQTRTILRMLENAVYMGDMVQGKSKTVEHQQRRTTADNYIIVRDTHEPIVSRELFEKVQRVRKEICDEYKAKEIDHYTPNIFKGKVFCADCGRPLHRQRAKRKTKEDIYRLHCLANTRIAKGTCKGVNIDEEIVIKAVTEAIQKELDTSFSDMLSDNTLDKERETLSKMVSDYIRELDRTQGFLRGLYENLVEGVIDDEEYKSLKSDYSKKIAELKEKLQSAKAELTALDRKIKQKQALSDGVNIFGNSKELTAELLDHFVERIEITHKQEIRITFRFTEKEAV